MRSVVLAVVLTSLFGSAAAGSWNVVPCNAEVSRRRVEDAAKVRAARPDSSFYAPVPFPQLNADVVRDLAEAVIRLYPRRSSSAATAIADGMRRDQYRYEVHRVADWTPGRCAEAGNAGDTYFLIVIRDKRTMLVIAEAAVAENGLFGQLGIPGGPVKHIVSLDAAMRQLREAGVESADAQYVATEGGVGCHRLRPCVASRNASGIYILREGGTWFMPLGGRIHSLRTIASDKGRSDFVRTLAPGESYVTLGADAIVVARLIK